jgi:hypothetical protein
VEGYGEKIRDILKTLSVVDGFNKEGVEVISD